jgi:hypothetical protein
MAPEGPVDGASGNRWRAWKRPGERLPSRLLEHLNQRALCCWPASRCSSPSLRVWLDLVNKLGLQLYAQQPVTNIGRLERRTQRRLHAEDALFLFLPQPEGCLVSEGMSDLWALLSTPWRRPSRGKNTELTAKIRNACVFVQILNELDEVLEVAPQTVDRLERLQNQGHAKVQRLRPRQTCSAIMRSEGVPL